MTRDAHTLAASLSCWNAPVEPRPIAGGITNHNFTVDHQGSRYFVRIGADIPVHGVMRFHELSASRAAHAAGISPAVIHHEPGALVLQFIDGKTLTPEDIRDPARFPQVVELIERCHREVPRHLRGPVLFFWVFHVIADYAATLGELDSRMVPRLPALLERAKRLERAVGPIDVVFGHNDLLSSNLLDDGERLWLIDFDYAGFSSPLFDLGGLASNNGFAPALEHELLERYFGGAPDEALLRQYAAMKCASLLRESMWSMVSEHHSTIDFDYITYSDDNLAKFELAYGAFDG